MQLARHALLVPAVVGLLLAAQPSRAQGSVTPAAIAEYRTKLAQYEKVHGAYEQAASAYWIDVADKRRLRIAKRRDHVAIAIDDYMLTQPPVYAGPRRPVDPERPGEPPPKKPPIPVVADFLQAAASEFGFVPDRPQTESEFKRAYARAALGAGLTREQIIGVYAFETSGNGTYDMQAGVTPARPRAISPALGYNQLLSTNTVSLLAQYGNRYLAALRTKADMLRGEARLRMERKIEALARMIAYSRSVPSRWSEYDKLAKTTRGGWGVHAAVLDIDIGPALQVQKLVDSVRFARAKGYAAALTAPELELMNLTGDGNGFDMVTMPAALRERVPTSNFFQREGYERNPVARRTGVVANLIADIAARMARGTLSAGAKDMAAGF